MLYPHVIHKFDAESEYAGVWVVIAHSNLTHEDLSWTNIPGLESGTYVPIPDVVQPENVFKFSSFEEAHRFVCLWWVSYFYQQQRERKQASENRFENEAVHFLTCQ